MRKVLLEIGHTLYPFPKSYVLPVPNKWVKLKMGVECAGGLKIPDAYTSFP